MTPMIDMVFLLLVFFMTVSNLAQADKSVEVSLPESVESEVPKDLADRGTITLNEAGQIYLGAAEQTLESMQAAIKVSLGENPALRIHVRADQQTPYAAIKKVLEIIQVAGVVTFKFKAGTHRRQQHQ